MCVQLKNIDIKKKLFFFSQSKWRFCSILIGFENFLTLVHPLVPWCSFWPSPGEEMRWCNSSHTGASHKHESFYLHSLCFFSLTFERITWLTMCGAPVSHCCTHIYYIYINMDCGSELKRKTTTALTISPVGVLSVKTPSTPSLWRAASSKYGSCI